MSQQKRGRKVEGVAPLAGSVDRNWHKLIYRLYSSGVAPLAGSVDRNAPVRQFELRDRVAPLAGSVDRNLAFNWLNIGKQLGRSPRGERG